MATPWEFYGKIQCSKGAAESILKRIPSLDSSSLKVLKIAAVLGDEFNKHLLENS